ncbi:MAG: hypothetical protein UY71_C0009G0012 [Parcubacteria group bacterium GW2011_GWB1_52_7]|nr:MAG: hypothetical protein UY64_C0004G0009 [Parcubacteria group bacterium GW2011_GWA1_51_12]KKW28852.1 MAG: hypothetical protein UY71_C0009G0012 [Parcubacteria group bacterium GW2011_GWB1_52_7]
MSLKVVLITIGVLLFGLLVFLPFIFSERLVSPAAPDQNGVGVYKSVDGGMTWALKSRVDERGVVFPSAVLSFVFHPKERNIIFLGTKGAGLWVSQNGGESWARAIDIKGALKISAEVYDIAVNRLRPDEMYLAVFQENLGRVLKSADGGRSFAEVYAVPVNRFGVFDVEVDALAGHVYVATGQGGFLESSDGGKSWRVQKWFPDGIIKLIGNPADGANYFALTSHGEMFRTYDRGVSWARLSEGYRKYPKADKITDFSIDKLQPSVIYTASQYGLLRSENAGGVWNPVDIIVPPQASGVGAIEVSPKDSQKLLAGAGSKVYKSDDFGEHWQVISLPTANNVRLLRAHPVDQNIIYAVVGR